MNLTEPIEEKKTEEEILENIAENCSKSRDRNFTTESQTCVINKNSKIVKDMLKNWRSKQEIKVYEETNNQIDNMPFDIYQTQDHTEYERALNSDLACVMYKTEEFPENFDVPMPLTGMTNKKYLNKLVAKKNGFDKLASEQKRKIKFKGRNDKRKKKPERVNRIARSNALTSKVEPQNNCQGSDFMKENKKSKMNFTEGTGHKKMHSKKSDIEYMTKKLEECRKKGAFLNKHSSNGRDKLKTKSKHVNSQSKKKFGISKGKIGEKLLYNASISPKRKQYEKRGSRQTIRKTTKRSSQITDEIIMSPLSAKNEAREKHIKDIIKLYKEEYRSSMKSTIEMNSYESRDNADEPSQQRIIDTNCQKEDLPCQLTNELAKPLHVQTVELSPRKYSADELPRQIISDTELEKNHPSVELRDDSAEKKSKECDRTQWIRKLIEARKQQKLNFENVKPMSCKNIQPNSNRENNFTTTNNTKGSCFTKNKVCSPKNSHKSNNEMKEEDLSKGRSKCKRHTKTIYQSQSKSTTQTHSHNQTIDHRTLSSHKSSIQRKSNVIARNELWIKQRKKKLDNLATARDNQELRECTFKPSILAHSGKSENTQSVYKNISPRKVSIEHIYSLYSNSYSEIGKLKEKAKDNSVSQY